MNKKSNKNILTLDKNIFGQDIILGILYENKQISQIYQHYQITQ